jgi:hypothetical protein
VHHVEIGEPLGEPMDQVQALILRESADVALAPLQFHQFLHHAGRLGPRQAPGFPELVEGLVRVPPGLLRFVVAGDAEGAAVVVSAVGTVALRPLGATEELAWLTVFSDGLPCLPQDHRLPALRT